MQNRKNGRAKFCNLFWLLLFMLFLSKNALAAGGSTHLYIAEKVLDGIHDTNLKKILLKYKDAYKLGALYPDFGYLYKKRFGEISHWDPFIDEYIDYINLKFDRKSDLMEKNLAFLIGVMTHRVSDDLWHNNFIQELAKRDFGGSYSKAHSHADTGIDIIVIMEEKKWFAIPGNWWVPESDLVEVYKQMNLDITKGEIQLSKNTFRVVLSSEHVGAPLLYPYYKLRMKWGTINYKSYVGGGLENIYQNTVDYINQKVESIHLLNN